LIQKDGEVIGSSIIAQGFSSPGYFHPRPSFAGNGYDPTNTNGSQLGPTNQKLVDRVKGSSTPVPIDLVTGSGSGLDPHITPATAEFQLPRIANERGITVDQLRPLVQKHTEDRQFGFLGEPRVNVLELNSSNSISDSPRRSRPALNSPCIA
jgi:potassium-transporting ATPase KdpC subunit